MARSKSSSRWLSRQSSDPYVAKAKSLGYRSRAVFKLEEIQNKYQIFRSNKCVVDLGAAPGAWTQYAVKQLPNPDCCIIGLDILPMTPLDRVCLIQGDFTELEVLQQLVTVLAGNQPDLVLSDMAPNISGNKAIDQPKSMYLAELALEFAQQHLAEDGTFAVKLFQGAGYTDYLQALKSSFKQVNTFKPKASRKESKEMYAVARGFGI
jgi:23S rRNA (uridine2552-2'-O)-methyltransferase